MGSTVAIGIPGSPFQSETIGQCEMIEIIKAPYSIYYIFTLSATNK